MRGCLISLGVVVGLSLLSIASCTFVYGPTPIRFRLTIVVRDGNALRTGSGVVQVEYGSRPFFIPDLSPGDFGLAGITGNAVTVDFGPKGLLLAILRYMDSAGDLPIAAYRLPLPHSGEQLRAVLGRLKRKSGLVQVPPSALPLFIHFTKIDDPHSAEKVDPTNLAASFGPVVKLERVMLELTNDPITPVPSVWPLWMKNLKENEYMDHEFGCSYTPYCLQGADFTGY